MQSIQHFIRKTLQKTFHSRKHEKHETKRRKFKKRYLGILFIILLLPIVGFLLLVAKDIPTTAQIGLKGLSKSTNIYDRHGKLLYSFYQSRNQTFVPLSKIPKDLQQATIAIEDKDFYKHGAIDFRGIARAFYFTVFRQKIQGGSTLTQQLVKNSILTMEQTITRKVKEIILSFIVEGIYSKDQILELYLNSVSYGGTAWGVEAASQVYFEKPVEKLTLAESAFLAGLPEAPSLYSPFGSHPERAKVRQREVLRKMREQGYITEKEEKKAVEQQLVFSEIKDKIYAPHFVFYVKDLLVEKYGLQQVERGGLQVITTLDYPLQEFAEMTISSEIAKIERFNANNAAALVTSPKTGEILAMVGSRDYFDSKHDGNVNVTLALRQPGSSIKPINYVTGLLKGYTAATPFVDERICFPNANGTQYCPVNYDGKFHGVVQMRAALANSYNIPAVKMLKLNTIEDMIATAAAMGIRTFKNPERYGLSLTLGGGEVRMIDMVEAFGVLANSGYRVPPRAILKVTDGKGKVLEEYKAPTSALFGKKVLPESVTYIISDILSDNNARSMAFGPNSALRIGNLRVAVKTGTTNDYRDNWTIGYTPNFVVATWVGNNDNTPMSGVVSGVTGAAPIWNKIMTYVLKDVKVALPNKPDSVVGKIICSTSGLLPPPEGTPDRCPTRYELFVKGTEPTKVDVPRQKVFIDKGTQNPAKADQTDNIEEQEKLIVTDPTGDKYCYDCPHPTEPTPTP